MERTEVRVQVDTAAGTKTVTALSSVTADDLMRVALRAYVREVRFGEPYESPLGRDVRDAVTRVLVAQRA